MMIEDDDILFLSSGDDFLEPITHTSSNQDEKLNDSSMPMIGGYKVKGFLGRGAFGEVRVGEHQLTGDKVALKFLRKAEIANIGAAERTSTEIQCLTTLKHQNIIRLQQVFLFYFLKSFPLSSSNRLTHFIVFLHLLIYLICLFYIYIYIYLYTNSKLNLYLTLFLSLN